MAFSCLNLSALLPVSGNPCDLPDTVADLIQQLVAWCNQGNGLCLQQATEPTSGEWDAAWTDRGNELPRPSGLFYYWVEVDGGGAYVDAHMFIDLACDAPDQGLIEISRASDVGGGGGGSVSGVSVIANVKSAFSASLGIAAYALATPLALTFSLPAGVAAQWNVLAMFSAGSTDDYGALYFYSPSLGGLYSNYGVFYESNAALTWAAQFPAGTHTITPAMYNVYGTPRTLSWYHAVMTLFAVPAYT